QLVLDRTLAGHRISDGIMIVVTGNRRSDKAGASTLPSHFTNVCSVIEISPSLGDWFGWALGNGIDPLVCEYLAMKPQHFARFPADADERGAFATPRQWAHLGKVFPALQGPARHAVAQGLVGEGPAAELLGFIDQRDRCPAKPHEILANPGVLRGHRLDIDVALTLGNAVTFQSEGDAKRWWPAISAIAADHGEILTACMERFYQAFGTAPLLSSIRGDARLRAIFESISDRIGGDL
ncbi:MAG: hypothetical protein KC621_04165, partial [Myxococcales bacterium]|nr:hypothetical protein [Myxococcales bacterium]